MKPSHLEPSGKTDKVGLAWVGSGCGGGLWGEEAVMLGGGGRPAPVLGNTQHSAARERPCLGAFADAKGWFAGFQALVSELRAGKRCP